MDFRSVLLALMTAVCLFAADQSWPAITPAAAQAPFADDYVIVQYDRGVSAAERSNDKTPKALAELGYKAVPVPPGRNRSDFIAELRRTGGFASVELDVPVFAAAVPNDPYYGPNQAPYMAPIGVPAAWDLATGRDTIVVAVLDSGLDFGHPDLQGRFWENTRDMTADGIDDDGNGCIDDRFGCRFIRLSPERAQYCGYTTDVPTGAVADDHGKPGTPAHSHGTLVAGIIGARGDNNVGVSGIAWNVRLMTVKVLDCGLPSRQFIASGDMARVAEGIDYARRMGANIINISLTGKDSTADLSILRDAIAAAQAQGIIIVAATGNIAPGDPNHSPGFPAAYTQFSNVVAVGSADNLNGNAWATYSNYGPAVDFAAPGTDVVSTVRSDLGGNPYGADSGTSFSTPLVSGMFALMWSRNSRLTAPELLQVARAAAMPPAPAPHGEAWAGAGVVNIGDAVRRVPFTLTGAALHDWRDVPPNSDVRAFVDGTFCGAAATALGVVARFALLVKSEAEQSGCGAPGKQVQIYINGNGPAVPAFTWGGRNADIGQENRDVSTVSPPPGPLVIQQLGSGWSNLAHLEDTGNPKAMLAYVPVPWTAAFHWEPGLPAFDGTTGRYARFVPDAPDYVSDWGVVQTYDAFWVNGPPTNIATVNPEPELPRTVSLNSGWNNLVYVGQNRSMADALGELDKKYTMVLQFDNRTQRWLRHIPAQPRYLNDFGGMFQLNVYWIYLTEPATLTMR